MRDMKTTVEAWKLGGWVVVSTDANGVRKVEAYCVSQRAAAKLARQMLKAVAS